MKSWDHKMSILAENLHAGMIVYLSKDFLIGLSTPNGGYYKCRLKKGARLRVIELREDMTVDCTFKLADYFYIDIRVRTNEIVSKPPKIRKKSEDEANKSKQVVNSEPTGPENEL